MANAFGDRDAAAAEMAAARDTPTDLQPDDVAMIPRLLENPVFDLARCR